MKQLKSHVRHDDPEIMSISHIHVLFLSSAISLIVSLTLPSWFPVLVLKLPNLSTRKPLHKRCVCSTCDQMVRAVSQELGFGFSC